MNIPSKISSVLEKSPWGPCIIYDGQRIFYDFISDRLSKAQDFPIGEKVEVLIRYNYHFALCPEGGNKQWIFTSGRTIAEAERSCFETCKHHPGTNFNKTLGYSRPVPVFTFLQCRK